MGVWKNIGRLARIGALQGEQNPGPTDVLTPAQTVQIIDDVSHGVPPLLVPHHNFDCTFVSVAGERPFGILRPGPGGSIIRSIQGGGTGTPILLDVGMGPQPLNTPFAGFTPSGSVATFSFTGLPALSTYETGTAPGSVFTTFGMLFTRVLLGGTYPSPALYLAPGQQFTMMYVNAASAIHWRVEVQDIPA